MKTKDCNSNEFLLSVHEVFVDNHLRVTGGDSPHKASSERWTSNTQFRQELWESVRRRYCERTGCEPWCFWFSVDGVAEAYLRWRKANEQEREETVQALSTGLPCC